MGKVNSINSGSINPKITRSSPGEAVEGYTDGGCCSVLGATQGTSPPLPSSPLGTVPGSQGGRASVSPVPLLARKGQGLKLPGVLLPGSAGMEPGNRETVREKGKIQVKPSS